MEELKRWEDILVQADAKAQAGGPDAEQAKADAQEAANQIRRLQSISTAYNQPESKDTTVSSTIMQPVAGVGTAVGYGTLKGGKLGIEKYAELQARENAKALLNEQEARAATQPRTQAERMLQGTIDPETGATGRARQVGYNEATSEQAKAKGANRGVIESLKQQGVITGENPLLKNPGFTASTPSGINVPPSALQTPPAATPTPAAPTSTMDAIKSKVTSGLSSLPAMGKFAGAVASKVMPYIGAYGVGSHAMETGERLYQGDKTGAALSAISTAGSGAAMRSGSVPTMAAGILASLSADAINYFRDHPDKFNQFLERIGNVASGEAGYGGLSQQGK
jgi:hypothetical protein